MSKGALTPSQPEECQILQAFFEEPFEVSKSEIVLAVYVRREGSEKLRPYGW